MINHTGRNRPCAARPRRGNTLVLVSGILALLVIIAAAYLSRTQAGRVTSVAEQSSAQRDNNARLIAELLSQIPADALFAWPVDPDDVASNVLPNSNALRLPPTAPGWMGADWLPVRYGIDPIDQYDNATGFLGADGLVDRPYNFAPYHVVPYTNWPDVPTAGYYVTPEIWPAGPGNTDSVAGSFSDYLESEGNPLGNPGFGDCRWLRDVEPMRWDWDEDGLGNTNLMDNVPDRFMGWRHLSYIGTPYNAWRICTDISDVGDMQSALDPYDLGTIITNLNLPVEQWMAVHPYNNATGYDSVYNFGVNPNSTFWLNWSYRFGIGPLANEATHAASFYDVNSIPANFYRLKDLNGNGTPANGYYLQDGERPPDEFVGPGSVQWGTWGAPRWNVNRVLADSDGDGYTDSFWWLAPTPVENGIRQVVAVSIIDNSAMLNVNAATRFCRNNVDIGVNPSERRTRGITPTDLSLVSQLGTSGPDESSGTWDSGFYDNPSHHHLPYNTQAPAQYHWPAGEDSGHRYDYRNSRWTRHLEEIGLVPDEVGLPNTFERLDYWQQAASRPLNVVPTDPTDPDPSAYTPFSLADELELRMYAGQNYPWIFSRYEYSLQGYTGDSTFLAEEAFLRAHYARQEPTEYLFQLPNYALLLDNRRKVTCFNTTRNDLMPPWLRWRWDLPDGIDTETEIGNFQAQTMRKVDLREPAGVPYQSNDGRWNLAHRLPYTLMLALTDAWEHPVTGVITGESYFGDIEAGSPSGDPTSALHQVRRAAAGWAANILAWRDEDMDAPLWEKDEYDVQVPATVPIPEIGTFEEGEISENGQLSPDHHFLGLEAQPFLLEAYIAHVYASEEFPDPPGPGNWKPLYGYAEDAHYVDEGHNKTTIIVVQIANPFNRPIDLSNYKIRVGDEDKEATLGGTLYPCREDYPVTGIFYAIEDKFTHDDPDIGEVDLRARWLDFLDIEPGDHPADTIIRSVLSDEPFGTPTWSIDPQDYDPIQMPPGGHNNVIELIRMDHSNEDQEIREVVVDRFDYHSDDNDHDEFKDAVENMIKPPPDSGDDLSDIWKTESDPEPYSIKAGIRLGTDNVWFVTSVRVTRGWGWDVDGSGVPGTAIAIDADEKAPRFVYASQKVVEPDSSPYNPTEDSEYQFDGDVYNEPAEDDKYIGNAFPNTTETDDPPWYVRTFTRYYFGNNTPPNTDVTRKPTFFDMYYEADPARPGSPTEYLYPDQDWSYPDKGCYTTDNGRLYQHSLQMLQKDDDFETVGELRHVFMFGHELIFGTPLGGEYDYEYTEKTFSEFMHDPEDDQDTQSRAMNRITSGPIIGRIESGEPGYTIMHPYHAVPDLQAGLRVFDAFVCDSYGYNYTPIPNEVPPYFYNAAGFSGRGTPGLVNLNTAMPEVMRSLPHWYKLVHEYADSNSFEFNPRVALPEAVVQYRERYHENHGVSNEFINTVLPIFGAPDYHDNRGNSDLRGDRGMESIGELLLLSRVADDPVMTGTGVGTPDQEVLHENAWRMDFGYNDPFNYAGRGLPLESTQVSTDVQDVYDYSTDSKSLVDTVAGDIEEMNLLFSGASNLVTTRSDMFTVYFKIRSFRQNPTTMVWDATDPEYIVDESRYVMLVDRSEVNKPTDKPKILYLEKLPN